MALLASDVMARAATLLNDNAQTTFTNTVLLPKLQTAWEDLQTEMAENGVSTIEKKSTAASLLTGVKTLSSLPSDFLYPIDLFERVTGGTDDDWVPMKEREFLPNRQMRDWLQDWTWGGDAIGFVGSTRDLDVLINYFSSLSPLSGESSAITVQGCYNYLAYRTAAIQAAILKNDLASVLGAEAEKKLESFINTRAKQNQALPVRRKPFRYGVMLRRKRRF